jgi:acyl carrier protein
MKPMDVDSTFEIVERSIKAVLNVKSEEITPSTSLIGDLGAESIDLLDLSCELEKLTGKELEFRKILQRKRQESNDQSVDITVQDIMGCLDRMS